MDTVTSAKPLTSNPIFRFAIAIGILGLAAAAYPYAYRWYGDILVSKGVSTSIRKAAPCRPGAKDPCVMPYGGESVHP